MALIDRTTLDEFLTSHPGWEPTGDGITRTFTLPGFPEAIGFVAAVGVVAEKAFHHPDIDIRYRRVKIYLTTHDEGGLTTRDTSLASRIDRLAGSR